jgi:DNA-binding MarR family transcriptional regulator
MDEQRHSRRAEKRSEPTDRSDDVASVRSDVAAQLRAIYRSATGLAASLGRAAGIHPTDVDALHLLDAAAGRPTMSELGQMLGLSSAAATALVDRLEESGLARRERDTTDRRRVHVELTDTAMRFAADELEPVGRAIERAIASTPPTDLAAVRRFLARLLTDEEDVPPATPPTPPRRATTTPHR